jgi:hypothetical protein
MRKNKTFSKMLHKLTFLPISTILRLILFQYKTMKVIHSFQKGESYLIDLCELNFEDVHYTLPLAESVPPRSPIFQELHYCGKSSVTQVKLGLS